MVAVVNEEADLVVRGVPQSARTELAAFRCGETLNRGRAGLVGADVKYNRHLRVAEGVEGLSGSLGSRGCPTLSGAPPAAERRGPSSLDNPRRLRLSIAHRQWCEFDIRVPPASNARSNVEFRGSTEAI
jgi:hypothetical protein